MITLAFNKRSVTEFIDSLIVFLNCSASYSIIPYIVFNVYKRELFVLITALINYLYIWRRFGKATELPKTWLIYIFIIINLWNVYAGIFSNTGYLSPLAYLILNSSLYILLYNIYIQYKFAYSNKHSIWLILRGYVWLIAVCICSVLISIIILNLGIDNALQNIDSKVDLFEDNVASLGTHYFSIFGVGILSTSSVFELRLPIFTDAGVINGIYHEPHIITFMVFPCLFFMWAYAKNKIQKTGIVISGIIVSLIALSTTNILIALLCIIIALCFSKRGKLLLIPLLGIIFLFVVYIGLENSELFFIADKLDNSDGSMGYTMQELNFAFNPRTIVGSNMTNTSYIQDIGLSQNDAGLITFILNIIFLTLCYIKLLRLFIAGQFYRFIGLGVLYFLLHSIKIAMVSYTLTILILIIFLLEHSLNNKIPKVTSDEIAKYSI